MMRVPALAALAAATLLSWSHAAFAEDNEAGVPLAPGEAAGAWTLESGGRSLCVVTLSPQRIGGVYKASIPASCGDALPAGVTGWAPSADGMRLVGADGAALLGFGRWSNSLFVSHRSSGVDLQLRRGS